MRQNHGTLSNEHGLLFSWSCLASLSLDSLLCYASNAPTPWHVLLHSLFVVMNMQISLFANANVVCTFLWSPTSLNRRDFVVYKQWTWRSVILSSFLANMTNTWVVSTFYTCSLCFCSVLRGIFQKILSLSERVVFGGIMCGAHLRLHGCFWACEILRELLMLDDVAEEAFQQSYWWSCFGIQHFAD